MSFWGPQGRDYGAFAEAPWVNEAGLQSWRTREAHPQGTDWRETGQLEETRLRALATRWRCRPSARSGARLGFPHARAQVPLSCPARAGCPVLPPQVSSPALLCPLLAFAPSCPPEAPGDTLFRDQAKETGTEPKQPALERKDVDDHPHVLHSHKASPSKHLLNPCRVGRHSRHWRCH